MASTLINRSFHQLPVAVRTLIPPRLFHCICTLRFRFLSGAIFWPGLFICLVGVFYLFSFTFFHLGLVVELVWVCEMNLLCVGTADWGQETLNPSDVVSPIGSHTLRLEFVSMPVTVNACFLFMFFLFIYVLFLFSFLFLLLFFLSVWIYFHTHICISRTLETWPGTSLLVLVHTHTHTHTNGFSNWLFVLFSNIISFLFTCICVWLCVIVCMFVFIRSF